MQAPTEPPQPAGRVVGRPLTSAQLDVLHSLLAVERENLAARLARSGPPLSPVRGDAALDRAMAALARYRARETIEEVEDALDRIDVGQYGRCLLCDRVIPFERLQAMPWTRYCGCASTRRRGRRGGDQ